MSKRKRPMLFDDEFLKEISEQNIAIQQLFDMLHKELVDIRKHRQRVKRGIVMRNHISEFERIYIWK